MIAHIAALTFIWGTLALTIWSIHHTLKGN
jgi:hypothetical protein